MALVVLTISSACEKNEDEQRSDEAVAAFQVGQLADAGALPISWQGGNVETDEGARPLTYSSNVYALWNPGPIFTGDLPYKAPDSNCRLVRGAELTGLGIHVNEVLVTYYGHGIDEIDECPDSTLLFIGAGNFEAAVQGRKERLAQEGALLMKKDFVRQTLAELEATRRAYQRSLPPGHPDLEE